MHLGRLDTAIYAMPMDTLEKRTHGADGRRFQIELQSRFSYPAACLVLMLVGVPLGVISRRGGKSSGFVFTLLLVILYYVLSYTGIALGRQNKLSAFLAVWLANILFAAGGSFLLWQMASGGRVLSTLGRWMARLSDLTVKTQENAKGLLWTAGSAAAPLGAASRAGRAFSASSMSMWFANS